MNTEKVKMMTNKSKLRILAALLALVLMLVGLPTAAFAASGNFSAIVQANVMKVYRDAGLKFYWGKLPKNTVVTVRAYSGDVAMISYGGRTGFAAVDDMKTVESVSKDAVAKCNTRVYQKATTRSRYVGIRKGTAMNVLATSGNVAKVERAGYVGYTRVDHLIIEGAASAPEQSNQDRFEEAFKDQQEAQKKEDTPVQQPQTPTVDKEESAIEKVFNSGKYSNEELCYAFLVKVVGYNHAAACGVVANIKYESGFRPGTVGDSGKSLGICQWNTSRKNLLISWCEKNDHDPYSLLGQLYFLQYELEERYPKIHKYLKDVENSAQGAYDAAYYFCYNFERPASKATSSVKRGNYAKETTYNKFKNL